MKFRFTVEADLRRLERILVRIHKILILLILLITLVKDSTPFLS